MGKKHPRIGLWLVGAAGGVGSTVALGVAALGRKLGGGAGLVTALPEFESAGLVDPGALVVGGHEIRSQSLIDAVREMHVESRVFSAELIAACAPGLRRMQSNVRPGIVLGMAREVRDMADRGCVRRVATPGAAVRAVRDDLAAFKLRHRLDYVVVVNVASSEPPAALHAGHEDMTAFRRALSKRMPDVFPSSALYALGAFESGCGYINFTASTGARMSTIEEVALRRGCLYMGRDGKTGETLLKSVLAPMFAHRNLKLLSWVGHNMLGNRDGANLSRPDVKTAKIGSKERLLSEIVGYRPHMHTSIEFVPSLADWKIASDHVQFEGFLNTRMNLQFVWTGCDSVLAAPLVIDLVRLTALEWRRGRAGRMDHLACFFKDPDGCRRHGFHDQWRQLTQYVVNGRHGDDA
ncbi:MAG: myo-inositol-1-phosphate synthase [Phycisphaerales bacterium]|nr:myo-inositol-1-phosphate synthase [Phycisphaerales bacterium]